MEKILIVILEACDFKSCEVHEINYKETETYKIYKMYLDNAENMQHRLFD